MAEEIVVKEPLWPDMIEAGKELTKRLDKNGFELVASFWFFVSEISNWRLVLASPKVDSEGPKATYSAVQKALEPQLNGLSLHNISVVSPSLPLIQILSHTIPTGTDIIADNRIIRSSFDNTFIEDAYIYRMAA